MDDKQKRIFAVVLVIVLLLVVFVGGYYIYKGTLTSSSSTLTSSGSTSTSSGPTSSGSTSSGSASSGSLGSISTGVSGTYIGCYTDNSSRVMPTSGGVTTWSACQSKAQAAGAPYFGMQYAGSSGTAQCYYGGTNYAKLGAVGTCKTKDSSGHVLGGSWSNAVYNT